MLRWIDRLSAGLGDLVAWVYVAVFAITVFDVVARYVFNAPTAWGAELVIAICAIHYAMSGAMALQRGDHVRIDVIYNLFPERLKQVSDVLAGLVIVAVLLVLIWFGWRQALPALRVWETTGTAWNSPTPVFMKLAIPAAGVLMLLQALANLLRAVRILLDGPDRPDRPPTPLSD
jgi:TRAP-type C4-dicarboxylate transport system permease small subunit